MNLLNQDNPVHILLNKIGDIVIVNLLFILCCLPVVTIGPAMTALYHCMLRSVKGESGQIIKTFLKAFKENFRQSLFVWLGILLLGAIIFYNIKFWGNIKERVGIMLYYINWVLFILLLIEGLYIFPVIAAFYNTTKNLLKNAAIFAIVKLPFTLFMAVITALPMFMTFRDLKLFPIYIFCWFFFGFGLTTYINSMVFYKIFRPYLEQNK